MKPLSEEAIQTLTLLANGLYTIYQQRDADGSEGCFTGPKNYGYSSSPRLVRPVDNMVFEELWQWGYLFLVDRSSEESARITQFQLTGMARFAASLYQKSVRPNRTMSRYVKVALDVLVGGFPLHIIEVNRVDGGYKWKAYARELAVSSAVIVTLLQNQWIEMSNYPERTTDQPRSRHYIFRISDAGCRAIQQEMQGYTKRKFNRRRTEEEAVSELASKITALIVDEIGTEETLAQRRAYLCSVFRAVRRQYLNMHLESKTSPISPEES